ncbi:MAG: GtrA family protein [Pseudoxanthomonas mexicana]|nr:GtrA family protein [Pseudoxanthomonas mexicana]
MIQRAGLVSTIKTRGTSLLMSERLRFLVVGGWNTLVGYLVFLACHAWAGNEIGPLMTLILSYLIAVPHSFATQRWLVFKAQGAIGRQLLRFLLANSSIFVANMVLLPLAVYVVEADPRIVQGVLVVLLTIASYLAHKYFSFTDR